MEVSGMIEPSVMRWTAKKKTEVILDLYKGVYNLADFCRKHDLKQSQVQEWMEVFQTGGTRSLKINSIDEKILREAQTKDLRAKIGELELENEVLKKIKKFQEEEEESEL